MSNDNLLLDINNHVALLTINREATLNSLPPQVLDELHQMICRLEESDEVKVVIITGAGKKAFISGGDLNIMSKLGPMAAREVALKAQGLFNAIEYGKKIYLAAINGYALGAGCELAMACDIRIAVDEARLGQPEVKLGIIPGWGGTQRLPRLVGKAKAKELMYTGKMIDAVEAQRIGLVNQVVRRDELLQQAMTLAAEISDRSQIAVRLIKEAVENGLEMEINRAYAYEADLFGLSFTTHDQKEGMQAFLEKRKPRWQDK